MQREHTTFGGAAGRVLNEAMSFSSLLSGLFISFALFVVGMVAGLTEATTLLVLVGQIGMAVVLARFAVNGASGEWNGTLFSNHGGGWGDVLAVAARYLILNFVWMLPLISMGLSLPSDPQGFQTMFQDQEFERIFMMAAYFAALALTPPVFLIIATAAPDITGIVTPSVWARTLGGRKGELFVVYAVYIGGFCVASLVSMPPILLVAGRWPGMALIMLGLTVAFFVGFTPNLLGRLCGFYVLGQYDSVPPGVGARPAASRSSARSRRASARATPVDAAAAAGAAVAGAAAIPASRAVPVPSAPTPQVPVVPPASVPPLAPPASVPPASVPPLAPAAGPPAAVPPAGPPVAPTEAPPPLPAGGAVPTAGAPKRVLLDVRERLEVAWERYAQDPQAAINLVAGMHSASFTPNPLVLHALTQMHLQAGDEASALRTAREALPILFERGNLQLAADLYRGLQRYAADLALTREQTLALGGALTDMSDYKNAANTFATVLQTDPHETRAVRGMLTVGRHLLESPDGAPDALRLFGYLRQQCPTTPFLAEVDSGQREAERQISRRLTALWL